MHFPVGGKTFECRMRVKWGGNKETYPVNPYMSFPEISLKQIKLLILVIVWLTIFHVNFNNTKKGLTEMLITIDLKQKIIVGNL